MSQPPHTDHSATGHGPDGPDEGRAKNLLARLRQQAEGASETGSPIQLSGSNGSSSTTPPGDPWLCRELRGLAHTLMSAERSNHTLQTTALVNEAWLRLFTSNTIAAAELPTESDRKHFLRLAAKAMRQILVDHARERLALKRGGASVPIDFEAAEPSLTFDASDPTELLALEEALKKLESKDPDLARIVEFRFFAGLTLDETARLLDRSIRQIHTSWTFAKGWLRRELA